MDPDDFMKRGFLLPEGCKDLTDAWKVKAQGGSKNQSPPQPANSTHSTPVEIVIPKQITVWDLATLLKQKNFTIIGDLMNLGVFATINDTLDFEIISKVAQKYGFIAKRAA